MKEMNICFIGTGWMGSTQIKKLSKIGGAKISVVVNDDIRQAKKVLNEAGLTEVEVVVDLQKALTIYPVDIVFIVSPNAFHGSQSLLALELGKHVFCEKPPAITFQEFEKQIELTKKQPHLITMVDYILYFNPMELALRNMVANDFFGTIHQIHINYRHPVNISDDKRWKLKEDIMGDAIGMGINHAISAILFIMDEQTKPTAVYATSQNSRIRGFEPDTVWNIMIRFNNGATGICLGNIDIENGYDLYHNIAGSKGGFIFDSRVDLSEKIRLWNEEVAEGQWVYPLRDNSFSIMPGLESFAPGIMLPDSGNVMDHQVERAIEDFLESVRMGIESPLSFGNTSMIGEIGWAARISAKFHREVPVPLSSSDRKLALEL